MKSQHSQHCSDLLRYYCCILLLITALFGTGLAVVLFRLHQYQGAQDLYARAYDIQSSKLGPEDKEVATTMNNTAGLLKAMGKLADAEVVYRTVSTPMRLLSWLAV